MGLHYHADAGRLIGGCLMMVSRGHDKGQIRAEICYAVLINNNNLLAMSEVMVVSK